ncbi:MAG: hypothetical protein IEMM0002_1526 [bacterium]|nr:MAG: hypothetical protein IEMM0002_1526 [bacterium]
MSNGKKRQPKCSHCGGVFAFTDESYHCIMCGRDRVHVCESCTAIPRIKRRRGRMVNAVR